MKSTVREVFTRYLQEKQKHNPGFSLRAFSKELEVSPAALSQILNGKRTISKKTLQKALKNISWDATDAELIYATINPNKKSEVIPMDEFHVMVDWYYFAILSLSETVDFQSTPKWVAERLNISVPDATQGLERLTRLGMLAPDAEGTLRPRQVSFQTSDNITNLLIQKRHRQHLELAINSLQCDSIDERDFTAVTMAIDPQKLPAAKKMIREFRDRLCQFLETDNQSEVYLFNQQLFPLTRLRKQEENQK